MNLAHYLDEHLTYWFADSQPTAQEVAERARRIWAADLSYPIILSAEGWLLDGQHRLTKAWMLGLERIAVVRFRQNPEPDHWKARPSAEAATEESERTAD